MPCDKKDGEAELKIVVQVVVVDDDGGAEDDPDRDNRSSRELGLVGWPGGCGRCRRREEVTVVLLVYLEHLGLLFFGEGHLLVESHGGCEEGAKGDVEVLVLRLR